MASELNGLRVADGEVQGFNHLSKGDRFPVDRTFRDVDATEITLRPSVNACVAPLAARHAAAGKPARTAIACGQSRSDMSDIL
jgi:hypothetical protein